MLNYYTYKKTSRIIYIIKREEPKLQYKDAFHRYNSKIKRMAKLCDIEDKLTSYIYRHSFATHALLKKSS